MRKLYITEKDIENQKRNLLSEINEMQEELDQLNLDYSMDFDDNVESLIIITTNKLYELYDKFEEEFGQF